MSTTFRSYEPDQILLLPPDPLSCLRSPYWGRELEKLGPIIFQRTGDERAWKDDIPTMREPVKRVTKEELEHGDRQPPSVLVMETFVTRDPMKSHEVPRITDCIPSYSGLSRMRGTLFLARMECDVRLL